MFSLPGMAAATTLIVAGTMGSVHQALAQPSQSQAPVYAFCWTPPTKQLVYVSAPFQTTEVRTSQVEAAFNAFVKKQYGYSANDGQCSGDQKAEVRDGKRAAVLRQAENGEVTPVTFTYTPAAAPVSAATPPPAAPPATVGAGLDAGNLKDPWLQKAKDELRGAKGYCETNILLHRIFDCDCFSRMVFRFRVAHAAEYKESHREEGTGWVGFSNILMAQDFVCTDCLEDARLTRYVHDVLAEHNQPAISAGRTTPAKVQAFADCVAPKYIAEFKAHPHVFEEKGNLSRAVEKCGNP
jgi:hypothetical protein